MKHGGEVGPQHEVSDGENAAGLERRKFLLQSATITGALGAVLLGTRKDAVAQSMGSSDSYLNVRSYGARGDGRTNDAPAIQRTINAAQRNGSTVYIPAGNYLLGSSLQISSRVSILGDGYQGDGGRVYASRELTQANGLRGTALICGPSVSAFLAATNLAVSIEKLQIHYPTEPTAGVSAITIRAIDGAGNANTGSSIRDVCITGYSFGIRLQNCFDFLIDHCQLVLGHRNGIWVNNPVYPDWADGTVSNCLLWGHGHTNHLHSVLLSCGGGYRFINNKFNGGGPNSHHIVVEASHPTQHNMEPLVFVGNSIEGCGKNGILFRRMSPAGMTSGVVITGNQIWSGDSAIASMNGIRASSDSNGQWLNGFTISGNSFFSNAGPSKRILSLNAARNGVVTGNMLGFTGNQSTAGSAGIELGSATSNINVQSNVYIGDILKTVDLGVGNTVGGGSA